MTHAPTTSDPGSGQEREPEEPVVHEWNTAGEALRLVFSWRLLCRTLLIALIVGTILSLVNQAHVIAGDDATTMTWVRIAANYLTPFVVSSIGALSATHR